MKDQLHGPREHDRSLMFKFSHVGYRGNDLAALSIVCRFRNLIHLFNTSKCNGITLDEFVVSDYAKISHLRIFSRKELMAADFRLWRNAIHRLCAGTASLPISLGRFICPPHIMCRWFTTADARMLYQVDDNLDTLSYTPYDRWEGPRTCYSSKYSWSSSKIGHHPWAHFASIYAIFPPFHWRLTSILLLLLRVKYGPQIAQASLLVSQVSLIAMSWPSGVHTHRFIPLYGGGVSHVILMQNFHHFIGNSPPSFCCCCR